MKLLRLIIIILIGVITLPNATLSAARKKKGNKTEQVSSTKTSGKKKSKGKQEHQKKTKKSSSKEKTSKVGKKSKKERVKATRSERLKSLRSNRYSRARVVMRELDNDERASISRKRESDSARLRHGGDYKLPAMGLAVERIANLEPMTTRFRRGDTTLTKKNIETLYFTREGKSDDATFFGQIIPKVDAAIKASNYKEAYAIAQKGLWRNPMHIGLIKRACELSEHEKDSKRNDIYIWQISELFHLIQNTGDGKTSKTAMRVVYPEDAYLYEVLWLETPEEHIVGKKEVAYQGCAMITYSIKDDKGKIQNRYYLAGQ